MRWRQASANSGGPTKHGFYGSKRRHRKRSTAFPTQSRSLDPEGKVEVATESARTVFGLKPGAVVLDSPFDWMADLFRQALQNGRDAALEGGRAVQQFVRGEERFYRPEAVPILGDERLTTGVILVLKDVTQLRQQDEIKKSVIRTVSHQLNTPLTSVRMAIHLLLEEKVGALTEKQTELLLTAREDSERLHGILDGLLDISRLESGKVQMDYRALPPSSVVTQALEPFRRAAQDRGTQPSGGYRRRPSRRLGGPDADRPRVR